MNAIDRVPQRGVVWPAMCSTNQLDVVDVVESTTGPYLIDERDRHLLSANAGLWNASFGFSDARILEAVRTQLDRLPSASLFRQIHSPAADLAAQLISLVPEWRIDRVAYTCSGSSAVDLALRAAFRYHDVRGERRHRFLAMGGSYHGTTLGAQRVGGEPMLQEEHGVDRSDTIFLPTPGSACRSCETHCEGSCTIDALKALDAKADTIAALILEPTLGSAGVVQIPTPVLDELGRWCRERDILIIADEVATGFGRCGRWFDWQRSAVAPDMVVTSKALNAGVLPLAALLIGRPMATVFIDAAADLIHGETQGGNPMACAAALATIAAMREDDVLTGVNRRSEQLGRYLSEGLRATPGAARVERNGLMVGVHVGPELRSKVLAMLERIRESGIVVHPSPLGLSLFPPYNLTDGELGFLAEVVTEVISDEVAVGWRGLADAGTAVV